ncbi:phage baseplate assembly protein [Serratia marcescens]|uniref:phage baseplate assembly protein domain-containing protein n=2 Tax=Serratia TaxID=613 RepID=UPI0006CB550F|nr:phage baseplate assembly protein [Serratia marcescens]ALE97487.1 Bacteriophage Mu Gp45 protein [Serratia marcescens]MBH2916027.1 phage baseplate assembly protein [Serratia marcescens]MBN5231130.1 phage baseplate assembly protein [Serratia marcescens]MBN5438843.1 phage baseplate assembly protein [Serratia marcescens]HBC0644339.1 phage baseplate assembly protein [Serratia marcescens]
MNDGMLRQLGRRVAMMIGLGKITGYGDAGGIQKLQYQTPLEVRGDTPRMAEFGFSSGLPVGTDVVLAYLGGDRSSAVIVASNNQQYRQSGLKSGETLIYNQWGMFVKLTENGIEVEAKGKPVTVANATTVTVTATEKIRLETPRLEVTGDVIDNCDSNGATLKALRDAHNDHDHIVKNVQSGNDDKTSEKPGEIVE